MHDIIAKVGLQNVGTPAMSAALKLTEAVFDVNPDTGLQTLTLGPPR